MKQKTPLQIRLQAVAEKERAQKIALAEAKKAHRDRLTSGPARKTADELARFLAIPLDDLRVIRAPQEFRTRSYNLRTQVLELIQHLFVRYPVPGFLYRYILSSEGRALVLPPPRRARREPAAPTSQQIEWEQKLFFAVAQGHPVYPLVKHRLTRKEAHYFLQAPGQNRVAENLLWAKLVNAGLPVDHVTRLTRRFSWNRLLEEGKLARLEELIRFWSAHHSEIPDREKTDVLDFLRDMLWEPGFSFSGRTGRSMVRLSKRWHKMNPWGKFTGLHTWAARYPDWETVAFAERVRAIELTDSQELHRESFWQQHCVYTYVEECRRGESRIVSLRWLDKAQDGAERVTKRITIEVSCEKAEIVQIRGPNNRAADEYEMHTVRRWAAAHRLGVEEGANA